MLTLLACAGVGAASLATAGCGGPLRILINMTIDRNADPVPDPTNLRTITVIMDNGEVNDRVSFELNREDQVQAPEMSVDKTLPFNIEVWACERETCLREDVIMQGCTPTPLDFTDKTDNKTEPVPMPMYDFRDNALRQCPGIGD